MYIKLYILIAVVIGCVLCKCVSSFYKVVLYQSSTSKAVNDNLFYVSFPIDNNKKYFVIPLIINEDSLNLIVDNLSTSKLPKNFIEANNGQYICRSPIPTFNAYKEINFQKLFFFNDVKLDTINLFKPAFFSVEENSLIGSLMKDGILGSNILNIGFWEFNMDKNYISVFSREDTILVKERTENMIAIANPIDSHDLLTLSFFEQHYSFGLDLGYNDEIEIDNKRREEFIKVYPYKIVDNLRVIDSENYLIDSVYVFDNVMVRVGDDMLDSCRVINIPKVDHNFVGAAFMHRFNFVLGYKKMGCHEKSDVLYIQKAKNDIKYTYLSAFDFNIDRVNSNVLVTSLVRDSDIIKNKIIIGDKIISINSEDFKIYSSNIKYEFQKYTESMDILKLRIERVGKLYDIELKKH